MSLQIRKVDLLLYNIPPFTIPRIYSLEYLDILLYATERMYSIIWYRALMGIISTIEFQFVVL